MRNNNHNFKYWKLTVSFLLCFSIFNTIITQPVLAEDTNLFSSLLNNFFSLFGGSKPTPTPTTVKQKNQLLQESVKKLLNSSISPTITPTPTVGKSATPPGTVEKMIDYSKYPEMIKSFLPKTDLLTESKKYATGSSAMQFLNSYLVQINTENTNEKIIHIKPGYCTMKLFMPETPTGITDKSVSQKSYQEIKVLDCRGERD